MSKYLSKILILALMLFSCVALENAYADGINLNSNIVPSEQELGKQFMRYISTQVNIFDDLLVNDYIQTLGMRLVSHSTSPYKKFHFFIVNDNSINAFSGPDGYIGINSGIIEKTTTESELAAVMAHEITHATQRHILRGMAAEKGVMLPQMAAMAAAIALGVAGCSSNNSANLASGAIPAIMSGSSQYAINNTRGYEREADRIGMKTLFASGFDPNAMPQIFERIQKETLGEINLPPILLDHPVTAERIADAKNRARLYPKRTLTPNLNYYLIKARLKALTKETNYQNTANFILATKSTNTLQHKAALYGLAVSYLRNHKFAEAENILTKLIAENPDNLIFEFTLADLKDTQNKNAEAFTIIQKLLIKHPDSYAVTIAYAETLISTSQFKKAEEFLEAQAEIRNSDPNIYGLLAKTYAKNNKLAKAYQARSKMLTLMGYDDAAKLQLMQAKKFAKHT